MNIRPVSDLRNKFPELEAQVLETQEPIFLTKNGYGTMVLMSIDQYSAMSKTIDYQLDEADYQAKISQDRFTLDQVVERVKDRINENR